MGIRADYIPNTIAKDMTFIGDVLVSGNTTLHGNLEVNTGSSVATVGFVNLGDTSLGNDVSDTTIISGTMIVHTSDDTLFVSGGKVGVGTASPQGSLDIANGQFDSGTAPALVIGADIGASTRTNATRKLGTIAQYHYTNANAPYAIIAGDSQSLINVVDIGGGFSGYNSATDIKFWTGSTTDTKTGTQRMTILNDGNVGIGTTAPAATLHVSGTSAGIQLNAGSLTNGGMFINQDSNAIGLKIDTESTSNDALLVYGKYGIAGIQDISDGYGLQITRNNADAETNPLVVFKNDHTSDTKATLQLQNDGTGPHITTGAANEALEIEPNGTGAINLGSGTTQTILPLSNDATTPTLAFGDGDTGFYESADDVLQFAMAGVAKWRIDGTAFQSIAANRAGYIKNGAGTIALPALSFSDDTNTGVNSTTADTISLVAGGKEILRGTSGLTPTVHMPTNNRFITGTGSDGTTVINMFKVNPSDEIEVGGTLLIGNFEFPEDMGPTTWANAPVSSSLPAGSENSYGMAIDSEQIATIYAKSDGTGGIDTKRFISHVPSLIAGNGSPTTWSKAIIGDTATTSAGSSVWTVFGTPFKETPLVSLANKTNFGGLRAGSLNAGSMFVTSETASTAFDYHAIGSM